MNDVNTQLLFDADGNLAVRDVQDVEPILERNKMLRSEKQNSDWGRHIAEITNVILTRWLNEEYARGNVTIRLFGPEMDALVARKLKDPEWAYLRTDSAQVQSFLGFGS
jgi:hypothetical protein